MGVTNQFHFNFLATNPSTQTLSPLAQMDSRSVANLSAITGLAGGGSTKLDGCLTADVGVGFLVFVTVSISSVWQSKFMRLITDPAPGVTTNNVDPNAGPLIVLPGDYDSSTNAKIWKEQ